MSDTEKVQTETEESEAAAAASSASPAPAPADDQSKDDTSQDGAENGADSARDDTSQDPINFSKRPHEEDESKEEADDSTKTDTEDAPAVKRLKTSEDEEEKVTNPDDADKVDLPKTEEKEAVDMKTSSESAKENGTGSGDEKRDSSSPDDSKGGDSDKENAEAPMDLSVKSSSPAGGDVIMLSEEEEEAAAKLVVNGRFNGISLNGGHKKLLVRRLQEELRNEEAKLVLLKKIRQSQLVQHLSTPAEVSGSVQQAKMAAAQTGHPAHQAPPPLVRGQHQPQMQARRPMPSTQMSRQLHNIQRPSSGGPPPLVMAPGRHSSSGNSSQPSQPSRSSATNLTNYRNQEQSRSSVPQQPEQTPAQRQSAAKLALRKQLEKTLLQIPPPKPPPPEMNFLPSLAGNEFILLVGLEEVVKHITDNDRNSTEKEAVKYVFNPFTCVQCGTDFTPVWKRDKPGSRSVICEQCVTSNQKRALKQEHTNRLKSAFVKALQQEQEIEQRMQQQQREQKHEQASQREHQREQRDREHRQQREQREQRETSISQAAQAQAHAAALAHSALTAHHAMAAAMGSPVNLSTAAGIKPTSEQIRQHANLLQAHQAQLRNPHHLAGLQGFNPRSMFPFTPPITKADLQQRQYLLNMLPRQLPGGWKT